MLSIGALLGGLVGEGVSHVWAGTSPGAFALLGMAALFAGASRGPIASVVIASELSDDYRLVLPLVFVCGAAAVVSRRLERGSLYRLGPRRQRSPRQAPPNPQIPLRPARTVAELVCGTDLMLALYASDPRPLFVVDGAGRLRGALHPETVRRRLAAESLPHLLVANDLADREHPRLSARASLEEATTLFESNRALRFVPVIDDLGMLLGEVSRESLL
jgi:CIC family chloride channel protein